MHPWTTRTLQAAVVAAGFAAVGTATASAEEAPLPAPDLSQVPDEIGVSVPVDTCEMQGGTAQDKAQAPCADAQFQVSTPNLVKQVGADITTTTGGLAEELQDGQPLLAPGKPDRLLGHVTDEAARLERLTETRPTITAEIEPDHTGIFDQHAAGGGFFEAEIGPRQPDHQGVSAADTAVDLTVAKGYDLKPPANPVGTLAPALSSAPAGDDINSPALPKLGHLAPAANDMSALAMLDNGVSEASDQLAHDAATGLPKLPTGKDLESSPATGLLDLMLK